MTTDPRDPRPPATSVGVGRLQDPVLPDSPFPLVTVSSDGALRQPACRSGQMTSFSSVTITATEPMSMKRASSGLTSVR